MTTEGTPYLGNARCLRDLSPEQKAKVIGPFSSEERAKFNRRFHPTQLEHSVTIEAYERLYNIQVPDTSEDFPRTEPLPPGEELLIFCEELTFFFSV
jgi:hypothetical protein